MLDRAIQEVKSDIRKYNNVKRVSLIHVIEYLETQNYRIDSSTKEVYRYDAVQNDYIFDFHYLDKQHLIEVIAKLQFC